MRCVALPVSFEEDGYYVLSEEQLIFDYGLYCERNRHIEGKNISNPPWMEC